MAIAEAFDGMFAAPAQENFSLGLLSLWCIHMVSWFLSETSASGAYGDGKPLAT